MKQVRRSDVLPITSRRLVALIGPILIAAVLGLALFVVTAPSYATRAEHVRLAAKPLQVEASGLSGSILSPLAPSSPVTTTVMYTITDLGAQFFPRKINDEGQVLGIMNGSSAIWLPEPAYGLPAGLNDLSFLPVGVADLNNEGQIVGGWFDPDDPCSDGRRSSLLQWNGEEWTQSTLPITGAWDESQVVSINDAGIAIGWVEDSCQEDEDDEEDLGEVAARWSGGSLGTLGTVDGDRSRALAINDVGQIAGVSTIEGGENPAQHAVLWSNGMMTDLGTLTGTTESHAVDLNDSAQVIGSSGDRPFLWLPAPDYGLAAGMYDLAAFNPDPNPGFVYGINNQGQIVGGVDFGDGQTAYLWDQGTAYQLNDLVDLDTDGDLQRATDINENGAIVGYGVYEGQYHGFLLTPQRKWTVMLYLDADNDLDYTYPPVFNQLEAAADNPNVNVIVYWDSTGNGDTGYYEVQYDTNLGSFATYTPGENYWPQGELDSSASFTLSDFATWAMENYPAENYALLLSDHGTGLDGGLVEGVAPPYLVMNLPEMQLALATIHQVTGEKIDVLYMDMCLMGMIEDAYQFKDYIDYYVSSEFLQWSFDEPYLQYIAGIGPNSSPAEVAAHFASAYADVLGPSGAPWTIAAADVAQLEPLVTATNQLGAALDNELDTISGTLTTVSQIVQRYDNELPTGVTLDDTYVDLYDFASLVHQTMGAYPAIVAAAEAVTNTVSNYILYEAHGSSTTLYNTYPPTNLDGSHGVSIFFPAMASIFYDEDNYDFAVGADWTGGNSATLGPPPATWGAMLVSYFQATQPGGPVDDTPPEPRPRLIPAGHVLYLPLTVRN